jgi:hypothetical protein
MVAELRDISEVLIVITNTVGLKGVDDNAPGYGGVRAALMAFRRTGSRLRGACSQKTAPTAPDGTDIVRIARVMRMERMTSSPGSRMASIKREGRRCAEVTRTCSGAYSDPVFSRYARRSPREAP